VLILPSIHYLNKKSSISLNKRLAKFYLWCALVLTLLLVFLTQLQRGLNVDSDILGLLPKSHQSPVVQQALDQFSGNFSQRMVFLIGGSSRSAVIKAADAAAAELAASELFSELTYKVDADLSAEIFNTYYPFRHGLMSSHDYRLFSEGDTAAIQKNAMSALYSPVSPLSSRMLAIDPLFLFSRFLSDGQQLVSGFELYQDVLMASYQQDYYVLISVELRQSPFNMELQAALKPLLARLSESGQVLSTDLKWIVAGVPLHAIAGTELAKNEISLIGGGSVLGIVLLIFWVFRSFKPIAVAILSIVVGIVAATVVCTWLFGSIHILSLVFGASLVGVSIDYSFHYFCENLGDDTAEVLPSILPGISLGLLTSLVGYLALFIAPFPGLHQMAVFSSVGLLAAYLTVIGLYPVLFSRRSENKSERLLQQAGYLLGFWQRICDQQKLSKVLLITGLALLLLIPLVKSNDDVRLLRNTPDDILAMEASFASISGTRLSSEFFLVTGDTVQDVLEREEYLLQTLNGMNEVPEYQAVTQLLPSVKRQALQREWLAKALEEDGSMLSRYLQDTGFEQPLVDEYKALVTKRPAEYLTLERWLASPASKLYRQQWINNIDHNGHASIVFLYDLTERQLMRDLAGRLDGVEFVDQVNDVSTLFQQYRQLAVQAVLFSYGLIFLLLLLRYSWRQAVRIVLPPLYAAAFAMAITVLLGFTVNLFSVLALLLVLAIGIDYTLFYAESRTHSRRKTALAITLSCATTLLAFGLLALSETPAIKSFGLTIASGIAFAFLFSPIASVDDNKA